MAQVFLTLHLYLQTGYACMHAQSPQLCLTLWTVAHQAPVSMGLGKSTGVGYHFLEFPASPASPALQADSLPMTHQGSFLCLVIFE